MLVVKANSLIRLKPISGDVPPTFHPKQPSNNRKRVKSEQLLLVLKKVVYKDSCASKTEVMLEDKVGCVYLFEDEVKIL